MLARRQGRIGRLTLNRPKALNALDLSMVRQLSAALVAWRDEPGVHAVVIEGAGGRAFCAGGDIRAIRAHAVAGEFADIEAFFAEEYALNRTIADYPKPYVALVDGICMGGGIGVSVHGTIRVVTEAATFAMPETAIGLFPDIGATYLLPRLRGAFGMYLALVGARATGVDAAWVGLGTHVTTRERLAAMADAVAEDGVAVLAEMAEPVPPGSFAAIAGAVGRCFGADSVAEIVRRLDAEGTEWSRDTLATLRGMSPSSLLWTFAIVRAGGHRSLAECLQAELSLTRHAVRHPDFAEGVRAMVVDKDRKPRWSPARIEDVDPASIAAALA